MSAAVRFAADVALAWLMPWRAVLDLRESRRSLDVLVLTLGHLAERRAPQAPTRRLYLVE